MVSGAYAAAEKLTLQLPNRMRSDEWDSAPMRKRSDSDDPPAPASPIRLENIPIALPPAADVAGGDEEASAEAPLALPDESVAWSRVAVPDVYVITLRNDSPTVATFVSSCFRTPSDQPFPSAAPLRFKLVTFSAPGGSFRVNFDAFLALVRGRSEPQDPKALVAVEHSSWGSIGLKLGGLRNSLHFVTSVRVCSNPVRTRNISVDVGSNGAISVHPPLRTVGRDF